MQQRSEPQPHCNLLDNMKGIIILKKLYLPLNIDNIQASIPSRQTDLELGRNPLSFVPLPNHNTDIQTPSATITAHPCTSSVSKQCRRPPSKLCPNWSLNSIPRPNAVSVNTIQCLRRRNLSALNAPILSNAHSQHLSEPFREPVDWQSLGLFDYPKIIKNPMDLGLVKQNLNSGKYKSIHAAAADVRLIWKNCMTYNADGSDLSLIHI